MSSFDDDEVEGGGEQMPRGPAQPSDTPVEQQDVDMGSLEAVYTPLSAVQQEGFTVMKGLGYEDRDAFKFGQVLEEKINEGQTGDWSAAYAIMKVEGKTDAEAEQFAELHTHSPIYWNAYNYAMAQGKRQEFAERYATAYKNQKKLGKSDEWAGFYAAVIAQGKSGSYAHFFAQKRSIGKTKQWADAYATAIEKYHSCKFAATVAEVYTTKVAQGMSKQAAQIEAYRIASANKGNDINGQDENGDTDLMKAVQQNELIWAMNLINSHANCNIQNLEQKTALMIAAEQGNLPMVALLLEADPMSWNITDLQGNTALDLAKAAQKKVPKEDGRKQGQYSNIIKMLRGLGLNKAGILAFIKKFIPSRQTAAKAAVGLGITAALSI